MGVFFLCLFLSWRLWCDSTSQMTRAFTNRLMVAGFKLPVYFLLLVKKDLHVLLFWLCSGLSSRTTGRKKIVTTISVKTINHCCIHAKRCVMQDDLWVVVRGGNLKMSRWQPKSYACGHHHGISDSPPVDVLILGRTDGRESESQIIFSLFLLDLLVENIT